MLGGTSVPEGQASPSSSNSFFQLAYGFILYPSFLLALLSYYSFLPHQLKFESYILDWIVKVRGNGKAISSHDFLYHLLFLHHFFLQIYSLVFYSLLMLLLFVPVCKNLLWSVFNSNIFFKCRSHTNKLVCLLASSVARVFIKTKQKEIHKATIFLFSSSIPLSFLLW